MSGTIFDPERVDTEPGFTLGSLAFHSGSGKGYVYLQANGASKVGAVCFIQPLGQATPTTTTLAATNDGAGLGTAQVAIPDDSYGWYQVFGAGQYFADGAVTAGNALHTGTAGELDDADSVGNVYGILSAAASAAGLTNCQFFFPTVQEE